MAKQKANMILLEEEYGYRELSADNKKMLEIFLNDNRVNYKGQLSIYVVKKIHGLYLILLLIGLMIYL